MFKTLKFKMEPSTTPPPPAATVQRLGPWWHPVVPAPGFAALVALSHDLGLLGPMGPVVGDGLGERVEGSLRYGGKWDVEGLRRKQFPNFCVIFGGILAFWRLLLLLLFFFWGGGRQKQVGRWVGNFSICAFVVGETL